MRPDWSALKARVSNRLARDLGAVSFRLQNKAPMVSFTFDDTPKSSVTTGVPILDEYEAKGTFYIASSLVDQWSGHWMGISNDEIVRLHRDGHEIACHTFSHVRTPDLNEAALAAEIEKNRRYLLTLDPSINIRNFAYPYGLGSVSHKRRLKQAFLSSRGIMPGANSGTVDLQYLNSTPLIDRHIDADGIDRAYDEAIATNGWVIFYGHDVAPSPSPYGCTPELLRHALDEASRRNIQIRTVADALASAGA
jgi:peptidoglycan/xylan/chitin deacetylase (PgdA/CDA1 family)